MRTMESETLLAVNICLLPDPATAAWAYSASEQAAVQLGGQSLLRKGINAPHITLWMGLLETNTLGEVEQAIMPLFFPFSVEPGDLYVVREEASSAGVWSLGFKPGPTLVQLHAIVMELMENFEIRSKVESKYFADGASERACRYVQNFRNQHALRHYVPHITLGYAGELTTEATPGSTEMQEMAMFRMGEGCTCRRRISNAGQSGFPA